MFVTMFSRVWCVSLDLHAETLSLLDDILYATDHEYFDERGIITYVITLHLPTSDECFLRLRGNEFLRSMSSRRFTPVRSVRVHLFPRLAPTNHGQFRLV